MLKEIEERIWTSREFLLSLLCTVFGALLASGQICGGAETGTAALVCKIIGGFMTVCSVLGYTASRTVVKTIAAANYDPTKSERGQVSLPALALVAFLCAVFAAAIGGGVFAALAVVVVGAGFYFALGNIKGQTFRARQVTRVRILAGTVGALALLSVTALATNRTGYLMTSAQKSPYPNSRETCDYQSRGHIFSEYTTSGTGFDKMQVCTTSSGTLGWWRLPTPTGTVVP